MGRGRNTSAVISQIDRYLMLNKAIAHLNKDKILRRVISKHSFEIVHREIDLFSDIVETIIGQQLSNKAADTIIRRVKTLFSTSNFEPEVILKIPDQKFRDSGTSWAKAKYIKNFSQAVVDKTVDLQTISSMSDEEVISMLVKVKGIGRWTAEMILIFSLKRPDVFSLGDLGLCTAVAKHYGVSRDDKKAIEEISQNWSPYRSLACRYLWKSLDNEVKIKS